MGEFLASKGRGELEVLKAFEDATIVKPASIVGDEDRFLNPMGGLAKLLKAIPVVNDGNQLLQPITCSDVATGIIAALDRSDMAGNSYYMAGPDAITMAQLAHFVFDMVRLEPRLALRVLRRYRPPAHWSEPLDTDDLQ